MKITALAGAMVLASCGQPEPAASNDPAEVTQAELDLLEEKAGAEMDANTTQTVNEARRMLYQVADMMPAAAQPAFKASLDESLNEFGPQVRETMKREVAKRLTLAEIRADAASDPARAAEFATGMHAAGVELGESFARTALLDACEAAGASAATQCTQMRAGLEAQAAQSARARAVAKAEPAA